LEGQLPGGPFEIHFDFNPNQPTTPISFVAHAPGLALKPLLAALGLPGDDAGALEVNADLHSSGDTPHAIAAGLNGYLGLALVNGAVDNRLLARSLDELLRDAKLPVAIGGTTGHSDVRCFALRADANHGIATLRAFMLDMTHIRVTGIGTVDFGGETIDLRLRPLIKVAGSGIVVPVHVVGFLSAPHTQTDTSAATESAAGLVTKFASRSGPFAPLLGALEGQRLLGGADTGDCGPALALARGGRQAPLPAPPKQEKGLSGRDLLKSLLR
jgi:AsmA protein